MKIKTILISLLAILSSLFNITVRAETTAPSSFYLQKKDISKIDGSYYLKGSTIDVYFQKNAEGKIVYCVEKNDLAVRTEKELYTFSKESGTKISYILENGYPNKYIFGSAEKDYFTTALAVWYIINPGETTFTYFDLDKGTYRGENSDIVVEVAKLVNGAKNHSYKEPTLKLNLSDNNLSLSDDGK